MSYYHHSNKFIVSNHARVRIKERLNIKSEFDLEIDLEINKILNGLVPTLSDANHDYYKIPKTKNMYAVVERNKNLILTIKPVSIFKY